MNTITISEYQELFVGEPIKGKSFSQKQFDLLENFILANSESNRDEARVMGLSIRNGKKVITARQYVGTITLKDGTNIEILPKIYNNNVDGKEKEARKILIEMLRALYNAKSINFENANLEADKLTLFEIFIRMFSDEVLTIVKKGLKGGYVAVNRNENFLKGKLLLNRHIRENYIHKEKFYIEYDEFDTDQPENRLIKSTLAYLEKRTELIKNKQLIKKLLAMFDDVPYSENYDVDFNNAWAKKERNSTYYQIALRWSEIFLKGKTFTTFAGKEYATAIMFDMDALFESYIAKKVGQYLRNKPEYSLSVQDSGFFLFNKPERFALRPDMVITNNNFIGKDKGSCTYILDTKWKILSGIKNNDGISQSDMYQMYAYFKEYEANGKNPKSITLIYPDTGITLQTDKYENGNVIVNVKFINLTDIDNSIEILINSL